MIRYLYADQLISYPKLANSMFRDRANQFRDRLKWDVQVDENGFETDQYDDLNPLYVIWETAEGLHGGSMRFLPTVGRCMVNEHFLDLAESLPIQSPVIWECTRFCLSQKAQPNVAAALMLAGGEIMQNFGVRHFIGVFDARMVRIYRMIGASPDVLGSVGEGRDAISVGLWEFTPEAQAKVASSAGIAPAQSRHWFDHAFGQQERLAATA